MEEKANLKSIVDLNVKYIELWMDSNKIIPKRNTRRGTAMKSKFIGNKSFVRLFFFCEGKKEKQMWKHKGNYKEKIEEHGNWLNKNKKKKIKKVF